MSSRIFQVFQPGLDPKWWATPQNVFVHYKRTEKGGRKVGTSLLVLMLMMMVLVAVVVPVFVAVAVVGGDFSCSCSCAPFELESHIPQQGTKEYSNPPVKKEFFSTGNKNQWNCHQTPPKKNCAKVHKTQLAWATFHQRQWTTYFSWITMGWMPSSTSLTSKASTFDNMRPIRYGASNAAGQSVWRLWMAVSIRKWVVKQYKLQHKPWVYHGFWAMVSGVCSTVNNILLLDPLVVASSKRTTTLDSCRSNLRLASHLFIFSEALRCPEAFWPVLTWQHWAPRWVSG